jgi:hypothetical protein
MKEVPLNACCYECRWFVLYEWGGHLRNADGTVFAHSGECRHASPAAALGPNDSYSGIWPAVLGAAFCGDFQQHPVMQRHLEQQHELKK